MAKLKPRKGLVPLNTAPIRPNASPVQAAPSVTGPGTYPRPVATPSVALSPNGAPNGTPPAPSAPSPFAGDSQYVADVANLNFNNTQKVNDLSAQSGYDRTDLTEALRRRVEGNRKTVKGTNESYNRSGLLFSGKLSEAQTDIATQEQQAQADMQQAFSRREASRLAARQAIEAGYPIEQAALFAQAVDRQTARDQTSAANNQLPVNTPSAPSLPAPSTPRTSYASKPKPAGRSTYGKTPRRKGH
jgi:hypothetical protein